MSLLGLIFRRDGSWRGPLAPLARSLSADFERAARPLSFRNKRHCCRARGADARETDSGSTSIHSLRTPNKCPRAGETFTGEKLHDRFWIYWYQTLGLPSGL